MDVVARCADLATKLSYHDASEQFRRMTEVYVPKGGSSTVSFREWQG